MIAPLVITVPWDVSLTGDNKTRRMHWAGVRKLSRRARELARMCWLEAGSPRFTGKVRVSILCRRGRQMDSGNIIGGCKPLLDGLFVAAITPDDRPKYVELGGVRQETGKQWQGREEVVFTVEALEPRQLEVPF